METIRIYIENMFMALPKTEQVLKAKTDLLEMMEDKYNALKEEGKSENEAVGHVISEFGNIDELTRELGIETEPKASEKKSRPEITLSDKEADEFVSVRKKCSFGIAMGVMMLILAPAALVFLMALFKNGFAGYVFSESLAIAVPIGVLAVLVGVGLAILIVNGTRMSTYEKLEDKSLLISAAKRTEVEKAHKAYIPKFAALIASGFVLIAAGIVQLIILNDKGGVIGSAAVSILLVCIAVAVFLFILAGVRHGTNMQLLNMDEDDDDDDDDDDDFDTTTKAGRVGEAVNSALWTVAFIIFFVWGFVYHGWSICWIVLPIAGFLSGSISTIAKAASDDEKKK